MTPNRVESSGKSGSKSGGKASNIRMTSQENQMSNNYFLVV